MKSVILNMLYMTFMLDGNVSTTENSSLSEGTDALRENSSAVQMECHTLYNERVCFSLGTPWNDESRPVAKAPRSPEDIGTTFYLYSKANHSFPTVVNPKDVYSILNSSINKQKSVKIITHGFLSSGQSTWVKGVVGELLRAEEENMIVVDWNKGAQPPYAQAVANIRVVAVQTAILISILVKYVDIGPSSIHIIGHSLGAHLAGQCGDYLLRTYDILLSRITGLDPAGPLFTGVHPMIRLDTSDADFVDVIHTDNSSILWFPVSVGMTDPVGHVDFYPNGGGDQPECHGEVRCQHNRASKLFIESIRQSCQFIGVECSSYESFLKGECWGCENNSCSPMGFKAKSLPNREDNNNTKFYLLTNGQSPFCGTHYRITIVSGNETNREGEFAIIGMELHGARDSTGEIQLSKRSVFYKGGSIHRHVILANDVGDISSISFTFHYAGTIFNPISWRFKGPYLYLQSTTVERLQPKKRWKFCFSDKTVRPTVKYELKEENLC